MGLYLTKLMNFRRKFRSIKTSLCWTSMEQATVCQFQIRSELRKSIGCVSSGRGFRNYYEIAGTISKGLRKIRRGVVDQYPHFFIPSLFTSNLLAFLL